MINTKIYNSLHILSISFKSDHLIHNFIRQFDKKFKLTIVENSNNFLLKKTLEKKYKNLNVIISGKNLGFGKAFNLGIKSVDSKYKYVLHANPDAKINKKNINKLFQFLNDNDSAGIVSPKEILTGKINNKFDKKKPSFIEVEAVRGFVMMLNIQNCKKTDFFDENFFLYMEETDFCRRLKFLNKKIYLLETAEAEHLGGKSHNPKFNPAAENIIITWDILMQNFRCISMDSCEMIQSVPANEEFWKFFNENIYIMSTQQKINFMNT